MAFCDRLRCWQRVPCLLHAPKCCKAVAGPETMCAVLDDDDSQQALILTDVESRFTRAHLRQRIWDFAQQLVDRGIKKGDIVAMSFPNSLELVMSFLAATWLGVTTLPLNPKSQVSECQFCFEDLKCKWLLVDKAGNQAAETAAANVGMAVMKVEANQETGLCSLAPKDRCPESAPNAPLTKAQPEDVALILYTSGTTGNPKGVPLTHANVTTTLRNITRTYSLGPDDRGYVVMPLFHVHGLMAGLLSPLYAGGAIILPHNGAGFQAAVFWKHVARYQATWYTAVPTMHQTLLERITEYEAAGKPHLRFIRSCSSSLPPPVLHQLEQAFGAPVLEAYAMTEACHQMTSNPTPNEGAHKAGSVGKGVNVDVKILGSDGQWITTPQQVGEVCVFGKNVCHGYLHRPEANAKLFHQGYLRTDDQGYLDEDGYLFLTSRLKEIINRGGEKISPVKIDNVLLACPGVAQLFAFAAKHASLGEVVAVAVTLQPNVSLTLRQLNRFGLDSGKLRMEELPECIVYCDKIPTGPTGKVQRVKLPDVLQLPVLTETPASFHSGADGLQVVQTESKIEDKTGMAYLAEVVGAVLGVELNDSSANLVLDSFTAVRLSKELGYKLKSRVSPKQFVTGVNLKQLYAIVTDAEGKIDNPRDESMNHWEQEAQLPKALRESLEQTVNATRATDCKDVLLTGATGFLGTHLAIALLKAGAARVLCLVRGNVVEASSRLEEQLRSQQLWQEEYRSRLVALHGDVTQPNYGVNLAYLTKCGAIIHNAANVNHAALYADLRKDNVESTLIGIDMSVHITQQRNQVCNFVLVSSASVCGRRSFVLEPQPQRLENIVSSSGYIQCKWVAERIVENAAAVCANGPLRFSVVRPGAITGDRKTGLCNVGDSINRFLIGLYLMQLAPPPPAASLSSLVDMSPVDWVAEAIAGLTLQDAGMISAPSPLHFPPSKDNACPIYTLDNGESLPYTDLMKLIGVPLAPNYATWLSALEEVKTRESHEKVVDFPNPLLALYGSLRVSPLQFGCTASKQHMAMLASRGFPSPPITPEILRVYVQRFVELRALPVIARTIPGLFGERQPAGGAASATTTATTTVAAAAAPAVDAAPSKQD